MHDIHVADKIHKLILENAEKNKFNKVRQVEIDLGSIIEHGADITRENLEFNLKMMAEGTCAEGAKLIINKVSGNDWELVSISG